MFSMQSFYWRFLENYWYAIPDPPPRKRTTPLEVICVGPPRSGTESLQKALLILGYDYTFHGWDMIFEQPSRAQAWARLGRRKWFNETPGKPITVEDFDPLIGHSAAITDAAASCFAEEMIAAYPNAKVVLNNRRDLDAWMRSMEKSIILASEGFFFQIFAFFDANAFWVRHMFVGFMWPGLFQFLDSRESFATAMRTRGKQAYRDHCNKIRGIVPPENLLDWATEDGWEPLCKFLGKEIPDEPFPHINTHSKGWVEREQQMGLELMTPAIKKFGALVVIVLGAAAGIGYKLYRD